MKKIFGILFFTLFLNSCGGYYSENYNWIIAEAYYHGNEGCKIYSIKYAGNSPKSIVGPTSGSDIYKGSGTNASAAQERALSECE